MSSPFKDLYIAVHSSRDAPRVIPPSDAPPVVTAEVDPRGCAPPHCSKKIDELSLEYLRPSLWASSSSEELNNDMYSSFGTTYNRHLQSTLDLYLLMLRVYNHTHFKPITPTPVITASAIVEAVKKESGREKREGQGRLLGAFSKADSLRETLLERKNKKPRKVRHWKPNEVEEADFNSSTALGRLNSTTSLLGRLGIEPSRTKVESFAAGISGGEPCTKKNGEADIMLGVGVAMVKLHVSLPLERSLAKEVAMSSEHVTKLVVLRLKINRAMGDEHAFSLPELLSRKAAVSEEDDYDMCALAPGAHIGKESCIGDYGEVLLKFSIVALINSLCIYLNSFSFHQSPLKVCAKRDGSKIGKGSCQGFRSCYADFYYRNYTVVDGAGGNIGDGSCNNARSCYSFRGTVGNDSCNSYRACAGGQGTVHDGSCGRSDSSDDYACKDMRGRIGKDSCNDIAACVRSSMEACRGVYGYEIGSCACNMYEECSCEGGEEGYYCDNSGDVFTDAQKSTCKSAKSGKGREGDRGTASANIFSPDD
ncbi:predicted protein [Thalassiosira pseudonana CCMP1335]|uniref:DUF7640 domain-containing protein n=1 Tax=Thalassiosira pseudonana TaxID=35128 RepID=B8CF98_THAPS|nr:predicted protein [Thalassiosira pseudonana CCMP1335]EED87592.1 predicted protein [Thalassiosira pseudonana CCMP1335]